MRAVEVLARLGIEELGDAEVEQLDGAVACHQDVRRLEVAVHDQVAMGVLHGVAELQEQLEPRLDRQLVPRAT